MNYYNFVNTILDTAKSHKLVYEVGEGDIYEHLNSGDHKYPCVFLTVQNVDSNGSQMTVTGSLFYVDALLSDTSNKLQIQSTGMTTLQQIFMRLMDNYPDFDLRTGRYTPFDEKFADLCAGVFSNFTISFMDDICIVNDDIFEGDEPTPPTPPTPPGPEPPTPPEPEGKYMTITVDGNAGETTISPTVTGSLPNLNLQYRINNGEWSDFIVGTTADIKVGAGDAVQFKGVNESGLSIDYDNYLNFAISGNPVALSGNIMSLIDGVGETKVIPNGYCFEHLFSRSNVKTVSSDFLPATTLTNSCYFNMFAYCRNLTQSPELPATTTEDRCYMYMFDNCSSLVQAPELPATTLVNFCYAYMFDECKSLTKAPALPATTLAPFCYNRMFLGCSSLNQSPALPATVLARYCYQSMFSGCTSLVQALDLPATTLVDYCYVDMFRGCTGLVTAPALPATKLTQGCYAGMFYGCTSLNYVKCLAINNSADMALTNWLYDVASKGTFVKPAGVSYKTGGSGIPSGWTVEEIDAPVIEGKYLTMTPSEGVDNVEIGITRNGTLTPNLKYRINKGNWNDWDFETSTNIVAKNGDVVQWKGNNTDGLSKNYDNYIKFTINNEVDLSGNVMSLIDEVGETTVIPCDYCFYRIFVNTKIKNVSKYFLPATTLADYCYYSMFSNCTAFTTAPELPAIKLTRQCYDGMFSHCYSLTEAPALPATELARECYSFMFNYCTSITEAPALPSTKLVFGCYKGMFENCTSLTEAPSLPATELEPECYKDMFQNCTLLTKAPELNATKPSVYCYNFMFDGCSKLSYIKCLATDISSTTFTKSWLEGVAHTGTFIKKSGVNWTTGVNGIPEGWTVEEIDAPTPPGPEPPTPPEPTGKYMTITVDGNAGETTISPTVTGSLPNLNLQYRINNGEWSDFIVGTTADIHAVTGDVIQWKGVNESGISTSDKNYMIFSISGNTVSLSGNVMSLIDGVGETLVIPNNYCFYRLFMNSNVKTVSQDFLPATTLARSCYSSMFDGCTSLVKAPELPATTIANYCYSAMFYECSSLTKSPELHATTLAEGCYRFMFKGCSLTTAPALPATTLAEYCYSYMFYGCTSLTKAPELPSTTIVGHCYEDMFWGCTSLTTAPKLPATTLAGYCYAEMFEKCTSLVTAPELPATTLAEWCYFAMFGDCTSLTQAPELPATTLAESCYQAMFDGCTSLVKAPELPATTLAPSSYRFMFRYCSKLNYVKCLLIYTNTKSQEDWLYGVASKGTFVKPYSATYVTGSSGIPSGWNVSII